MKAKFTEAPILATHDLEQDTILETNALNRAIRGCISQRGNNKLLYLIAYYSRKLIAAKLNYDVHDKELLAIVDIMQY